MRLKREAKMLIVTGLIVQTICGGTLNKLQQKVFFAVMMSPDLLFLDTISSISRTKSENAKIICFLHLVFEEF